MNEQCETCGWHWEKCDEHERCNDCPMYNMNIDCREACYCLSIVARLNDKCPYFVPREESDDEDSTEM